ncbi:MAG: EsaB/YukD family protein [Pyrinomonadaceae bacterium]
MADIKVKVITMGGEEKDIETPTDIKADDFIKELVIALNLPLTDAEGHQVSWRIDNKDTGRTLDGSKTLDENEVKDGHRLSLIRATVAGR